MNKIIIYVGPGYIAPGNKGPIVCGRAIGTPGRTNFDVRPDRRPAIVPAIFSPGYPGRCPVIPGNPHPAVTVIIKPITIVERSPTPVIIRNPGPSIRRKHPVSRASIRTKSRADGSRYPHISVLIIIHPRSIRRKLVVKNLEAYGSLGPG